MKKNPNFIKQNLNDICASLQHSLITMLMTRFEQASAKFKINDLAIAGGVSANSGLRNALQEFGRKTAANVFIPKFEYCTDNAAMIAMAAHYKFLKKDFTTLEVVPLARMPIGG